MDRPKLRKVDRFEHTRGSEELIIVRDPLRLADSFALNAEFAAVLTLLDGTHTLAQIRQSLLMGHGLELSTDDLRAFVDQLRTAGLLDDDSFRERWAAMHSDFVASEVRDAMVAGLVYPADPHELAATLEHWIPTNPDGRARLQSSSPIIGVLAPHGPIDRTGALLDETLRGLPSPDTIESIVLLGTDHGPGLLPYVATKKSYGTPLGSLRPAGDLYDALERRVPWIGREQVRHRDALSLELGALYLHHLYGPQCPPLLPILCGATAIDDPEQQQERERFELALGSLCEDRPILWWLSAELSHAGPAYGRPALSQAHQIELQERDAAMLIALRDDDEQTLERLTRQDHPQGPPSGGATLIAATRVLPTSYRAELVRQTSYEAPGSDPGVVSVAGMRLHAPAKTDR